ncbi:autotransporter outer membrane beta-barrel domain-containing protein [Brucella rhizosphaerae]|nr:autotransporter outer membrane beta-barrel domain-containing protein [Brucella rhizosphaerae]
MLVLTMSGAIAVSLPNSARSQIISTTGQVTPTPPMPNVTNWKLNEGIIVGNTGVGTLTLNNASISHTSMPPGSVINPITLYIGVGADADGTVNVTGPLATVDLVVPSLNNAAVIVGGDGKGELNISGGARFYSISDNIVGQGSTGNGTINISGANSRLAGSLNLFIGYSGKGELNITNGGGIYSLDTDFISNSVGLFVGENEGSVGSVMVSGIGSLFNSGDMNDTYVSQNIGGFGTGSITISDGGVMTISSVSTSVGYGTTGKGDVLVTGAGSVWSIYGGPANAPSSVAIGSSGTGTLTISDRATVNVATINIARRVGSVGAVSIGSAAGEAAVAAGTLNSDAINFGAGTGTLNFNYTDAAYGLSAAISGSGTINQLTGITTLTGDGSGFTGTTNVTAGTLQIGGGGTTGSLNGSIINDTHVIFNRSDAAEYTGALSGAGDLRKLGGGALTMSGDSGVFTGLTGVEGGSLFVSGTLGNANSGAVTVAAGASLAGTGTIGGVTTIANGGTLIGKQGSVLTFQNNLTLSGTSVVDASLGQAPNAVGLFKVNGDLTLGGSLNVTDIGDFGPGLYRIFDYTGTLQGVDTLTLGTVPIGTNKDAMAVQTDTANQVNLFYTAVVAYNSWDGGIAGDHDNGKVDGGDGIWNAVNNNWTIVSGATNGVWADGNYALFTNKSGTVTLDDTDGALTAQGLVFSVDGYVLNDGSLTLTGANAPTIRVGDGTPEGAAMTATIGSELLGTQGLKKIDYGTLVLTGENTYTGGTTVSEGIVQLGDGSTSGSILGDVLVDKDQYGHGTLAFNRSDDVTFDGAISGEGAVVQRGEGTTTFAGDNSFSGGLSVEKGIAQAGIADTAFGTGMVAIGSGAKLDLANFNETIGGLAGGTVGDGDITLGSGTLTLNQTQHDDFSGVISGTGGLTLSQTSTSSLTLYGANTYSGDTNVAGAKLIQGAQDAFSGASAYSVADGSAIDLGGFSTNMAALSNNGTVDFGGTGGTVLNIAGNYTGNGGTLAINTVLANDNAVSDRLQVGGNTSGTTKVQVTNRGGLGAQTVNGIKVVDVNGQSNGTFTLNGDYTTKDGQQAIMTSSAYAYTLQKNSKAGPNDGNWYLVSQNTKPNLTNPTDPTNPTNPTNPTDPTDPTTPTGPRYSAAAPIYESYTATLQALNHLSTLQQRVGDRYLGQQTTKSTTQTDSTSNAAIWGRVEGAHNRLESGSTAGDLHQDINTFIMQAGVDGQFFENENGKLIAGITGQYGNAHSSIDNLTGDGSGEINTQGWGIGAIATWYGTSGFYLDAQAQANWYDSNLDVDAVNRSLVNGNKGFGYALSLEAGQRFAMDQNWSLTPQAQLSWSSVDFDTFTDSYGARISNHDGDSLIGRLGLAASYANRFAGSDGRAVSTSVYGIANLYQEFSGNARMNYAGTPLANDNDKTWGGIGAGGTYAWADDKYALVGEGSVNTSLNNFADSYTLKATIGFRTKW